MRKFVVICLSFSTLIVAGPGAPSGLVTAQSAAPVQAAPASDSLVIIVNSSNAIDNLSMEELRRVFRGERGKWPNGRRITVVMRERGDPAREAILAAVYGMTERDFERFFLHAQFTGEVQSAPKVLNSAAGMRKFIFTVPGAIGYVRAEEVDGTVKTVRIDNLRPGDAGYRIKLHK